MYVNTYRFRQTSGSVLRILMKKERGRSRVTALRSEMLIRLMVRSSIGMTELVVKGMLTHKIVLTGGKHMVVDGGTLSAQEVKKKS